VYVLFRALNWQTLINGNQEKSKGEKREKEEIPATIPKGYFEF
jgi:hypothetical protein